jgi:hypothetical protein
MNELPSVIVSSSPTSELPTTLDPRKQTFARMIGLALAKAWERRNRGEQPGRQSKQLSVAETRGRPSRKDANSI